MEQRLKIIGFVSVGLGVISALLCIVPFGLFLAILTGFFGMIFSSIYVFLDTKHEINRKRFTMGILGMVLSSIPILMMLAIIIMSKLSR